MTPNRLAVAVFFAFATCGVALAQAPVLQISGANYRPMPIAAPAPTVTGDGGKAVAAAFDDAWTFDLMASGLFQVLDRKSFLADAKEGHTAASIDFSRWTNVGAEALAKTQLALEGTQLRGELRLFTVASGKEELKVTQEVPVKDPRLLAHMLANALYKHFTRETGPFESHLVFVRRQGQNRDVYVSDWDGKNAAAVSNGGLNVLPALGLNGEVAFTSYRGGKPDLFVWKNGKSSAVIQNGRMATGVDFSADGKRIAYSLSEGESAQVWVANADGTSPRQLTKTPFFINSSPSWSPDGRRLAFVSNRGGSPQIYVMNADGSGESKRLTFQGNYNQTPNWSPRGDLIAFTARDERNAFDLFTVHVETGKVTRLTQDQGNNEEPTFSPNGRLIIFTSTRRGGTHLFVMTFDGNNQLPLPMDKGTYLTPDWGR